MPNPNHDSQGRFASGPGGGGLTPATRKARIKTTMRGHGNEFTASAADGSSLIRPGQASTHEEAVRILREKGYEHDTSPDPPPATPLLTAAKAKKVKVTKNSDAGGVQTYSLKKGSNVVHLEVKDGKTVAGHFVTGKKASKRFDNPSHDDIMGFLTS